MSSSNNSIDELELRLERKLIAVQETAREKVKELEEELNRIGKELKELRALKRAGRKTKAHQIEGELQNMIIKQNLVKARIRYYKKKEQAPTVDRRALNPGRPPKSSTEEEIERLLKHLALQKEKVNEKIRGLREEVSLLDIDGEEALILAVKQDIALNIKKRIKIQRSIRYYEEKLRNIT